LHNNDIEMKKTERDALCLIYSTYLQQVYGLAYVCA